MVEAGIYMLHQHSIAHSIARLANAPTVSCTLATEKLISLSVRNFPRAFLDLKKFTKAFTKMDNICMTKQYSSV
jgi:hypothetical protein